MNLDGLHLKDERRIRRNTRRCSITAVPQLGWDDQLPLFTLTNVEQALIPALDHLTHPEGEAERIASRVGTVKLGARLLQRALRKQWLVFKELIQDQRTVPCSASPACPPSWPLSDMFPACA